MSGDEHCTQHPASFVYTCTLCTYPPTHPPTHYTATPTTTTGRPKTITGFQTHTTPVLLSAGERAELGTEKYLSLSPVLEGVVILKKNPDYVEKHE